MAQLTQMQIATKYDVTPPDVSVAIREGMVDPVGSIKGPKREQKVYNESEVKQAIIDLYKARASRYYRKYEEWIDRAKTIGKVD